MVMEPSWQWSSIRLFLRNGTCATSEFRCKLHGIGEFLGRCSSHISRFQGVGFLENSHGSLGPKTWKKGVKLNISEWKSKRNIQNSLGSCVEIWKHRHPKRGSVSWYIHGSFDELSMSMFLRKCSCFSFPHCDLKLVGLETNHAHCMKPTSASFCVDDSTMMSND